MEDKQISGEESLKLINRMIYEAKGYFYESGISVLVYGFSIFICSVLAYLRDDGKMNLPFSPFYFFIPVFFVQSIIQFKEEKKKKAKTYTDEAIDYVWTGFFLSVFAALCGNFAGAGYITITIILLLSGFAAFLTGSISKFTYLIVSGITCLVAGAVSFFIQNENIYLFLAGASILIWIIPGFIMRAYFKKQQHAQ
jgi:hypothetical protein